MKPLSILLLIFFLAFAFGCTTPPKSRVTLVPETTMSAGLPIDAKLIDKRIRFLNGVLIKKGLSDEDRKTALEVLDAYKLLKKLAPGRLTEKEYQELIRSLFKAVAQMDETHYKEKQAARDDSVTLTLFVRERDEITDLYMKGDFKSVIKHALALKARFGPDALTPEIGLLFALSLAKEGKLEQAIQIGEGIAGELDRLPDIIQLRSKIAQWQLALGKKDKALHTYEKLTDNQDERLALIQNLNRQIRHAEKDTSLDKPALFPPKPGTEDLGLKGDDIVEQLLKTVHSLVKGHESSKARLLLLRKRIKTPQRPDSEMLDRELEKVEQMEEEFEEQK